METIWEAIWGRLWKDCLPTVEAAGTVAKSLPAMLVYTVVTILSAYFFIVDRDRILAAIKAICPNGQAITDCT